jgi:hypothetical protein
MESNAIPTVPILNLGNNNNDLISAIMSLKNGNANSDMMNNPFLWLIFLALFGSNGFGGFGGGNATTNADIQRLEGLINNNHNNTENIYTVSIQLYLNIIVCFLR